MRIERSNFFIGDINRIKIIQYVIAVSLGDVNYSRVFVTDFTGLVNFYPIAQISLERGPIYRKIGKI